MRSILRAAIVALGVFALVNLVLIGAALAWLFSTGRMDGERFQRLREIVATPIETERQAIQLAADRASEDARLEVERRRLGELPRTSAERAAEIDRGLDQAQLRRRMVEEEARLLGRSLETQAALLREQQLQLEQSSLRLHERVDAEAVERRDAQFRKTVQLLEAAPPRQSKEWLLELVSTGRRDEAVRYLNAMNRFAASRLLRELKSAEETALAADLLEALRRRNLNGLDSTS